MPKQMVDLQMNEVSGVDAPAHLTPGWLVVKSVDPEIAKTLALAEAVATATTKGNAMPESFNKAELSDDARAEFERLEKELGEAQAKVEKAFPPVKAKPGAAVDPAEPDADDAKSKKKAPPFAKSDGTEDADTDADEITKALETIPEPLRAMFKAQADELAKTTAVAKALTDAAETREYVEKASGFSHLPTVTAAEFGPVLRAIAKAAPEAAEKVLAVLKAADGALAQAELFGEIGAPGRVAADSGEAALKSFAKSLQDKDPALTNEAALAKAAMENPVLYAQHRREQDRSLKGA